MGIGTNKYSVNSDFRHYGYRKMISIYLLVRTKTFGDRRRMHFFSVSTARRKLNWNRNYIGFTSHASCTSGTKNSANYVVLFAQRRALIGIRALTLVDRW